MKQGVKTSPAAKLPPLQTLRIIAKTATLGMNFPEIQHTSATCTQNAARTFIYVIQLKWQKLDF